MEDRTVRAIPLVVHAVGLVLRELCGSILCISRSSTFPSPTPLCPVLTGPTGMSISCPSPAPTPESSGSNHLFDGSHSFSIGTAQMAGRDFHVHYAEGGNEARKLSSVKDVASWLCSTNYRQYHSTTVALRAADTGSWFFETPEFNEWLANEHGTTLWITGMPGAGKTVLASHSVDRLGVVCRSQQQACLVFVYCRYIDNCSTVDVLGTFLRQLTEDHDGALLITSQVYQYHQRHQTTLTEAEATEVLKSILAAFSKVYLVVDGLDEILDNQKMNVLGQLKGLAAHLLIFSRPMEAFSDVLPLVTTISIQARTGDIAACVLSRVKENHRLRRLLADNDAIKQTIVEKIQQKSQGMFLLAAMQIEALTGSTNVASLMSALEALPVGLDGMYTWTLQRIEAQPREESLLAKKALLWLTFSKGPLTMADLQRALATSQRAENGASHYDPLCITPADIILTACCGLVSGRGECSEVKLIHYTTQEYLMRIGLPHFLESATITTFSCLAYILCLFKENPQTLKAASKPPFLEYALTHWPTHAKDVVLTNTEFHLLQLCQLLDELPDLPCCLCCVSHTPFQFAVCREMLALLPRLQCRDEITPGSSSYPSLHLAIHLGRTAAASALVYGPRLSPVDLHLHDQQGRTPLNHAISMRNLNVLDLLLNHPEIDVNLPDAQGRTPLFLAMQFDNEDIFKKLLQHPHCDPNQRISGTVPLHMISRWSFPLIDLDVGWKDGAPLLILASLSGRPTVVELLLEHPNIDINATAANGDHSLSWLIPCQQVIWKLPALWPKLVGTYWYKQRLRAAVLIACHPSFGTNLLHSEKEAMPLFHLVSQAGCEALLRRLLHLSSSPNLSLPTQTHTAVVPPLCMSTLQVPEKSAWIIDAISSRLWRRSGITPKSATVEVAEPKGAPSVNVRSKVVFDINACDRQGLTPVFYAQTLSSLRLFLSCNSLNPNHQDLKGNTILIRACTGNNIAVVELLLQRPDINLNISNLCGTTALMVAVKHGGAISTRLARLLIGHSNFVDNITLNLNRADGEGRTVLHHAVEAKEPRVASLTSKGDTLKYLLSLPELDPNLLDKGGRAPIHLASYHGAPGVIKALVRRPDVNINLPDQYGSTALHILSQHSHILAALPLIWQASTNINALDHRGNAAIHICAERGDASMLRILLWHPNIDPNLRKSGGYSALHVASRLSSERSGEVLSALLCDKRVDVNLRDSDGYAAVDILSSHLNASALQLILSHPYLEKDPLNYRRNFYSACWRVIYSRQSPRQRALDWRRIGSFLQYDPGAVRATDGKGRTVLHHAAKEGQAELITRILDQFWAWTHVNVWLRDEDGKSAVDYATDAGHDTIRNLLLNVPPWLQLFEDSG
ncbi:hypothetical protein NMY22_g9920 [Coprinellus aureogranulatus]|nr:hypothetical protein NMY22_g9920 [Coprinellus aureogranulatus]